MDNRREFLKKAMLLSGATGLSGFIPASIQKALAIDPAPDSGYMDAEHVVILMQENRSFDHCFGSLSGVRGFNDPRAIDLPDKNKVWLQSDASGQTYAPFRFDIRNSKVTWMSCLPHGRHDQVDAFNEGRHDNWLNSKRSSNKEWARLPLTMGYYTRQDIPFYYALADAFTICDQHFSSAMTSTWPNRLYMWAGAIRSEKDGEVRTLVRNDIPYEQTRLRTFPELLEENNVSWKVYQNDICTGGGFNGSERAWLTNFVCNLLEFLPQYNVKFSKRYIQGLQKLAETLPAQIADLETKMNAMDAADPQREKNRKALTKKREVLEQTGNELIKWSRENYEKLSQREKNLFEKAFTTNAGDPDYHSLTTLQYEDNGVERKVEIPKGDILYQFRKDVDAGQLPTVSWLVPPQNFSDHPVSPWYGTWITSEILDILTKNPEVWQKTIFILTYDENDGYFDHIPPFVAPDPLNPATGKCSDGIDTNVEYIRREKELEQGVPPKEARTGPIGLGFRVPLIVASPWTRGGYVNSQVFDHTSSLQFLEKFLSHKTGKELKETNISQWRRTVCGDLTSIFRSYDGEKITSLPFIKKGPHIEQVYNAQFKSIPSDFTPLSGQEIDQINRDPLSSSSIPRQEGGLRPSCAIPYQLYADGNLSEDGKKFELTMRAANDLFGKQSAGAPFKVYFPGKTSNLSYAVAAGNGLTDSWPVQVFENGRYHVRVYGPNGFFREFMGGVDDPRIAVYCEYQQQKGLIKGLTGNILLNLVNLDPIRSHVVEIRDNAYKNKSVTRTLPAAGSQRSVSVVVLDSGKSFGWYDLSIKVAEAGSFERRYAGRVETGKESYSDPAMS
jgi:phospholipase C